MFAGPILFARGADALELRLAALVVRPEHDAAPRLTVDGESVACECLYHRHGVRAWRWEFELAARADSHYTLDGQKYPVESRLDGDVAIGYVSCNGVEHGDLERDVTERNVLWRALRDRATRGELHLMLHGGDQLYADEILDAHPEVARWRGPGGHERAHIEFTAAMADAVEADLLERYLTLYAQDGVAELLARVPSLMMWDDHDIVDGWGSLRPWRQSSPVGQGVYAIARRLFCLFQLGARDDALPAHCADPTGVTLGFHARFPGFTVVAPDLRSERQRRRVMDAPGWAAFEAGLDRAAPGDHLFVMSSVPAMGPRLSLAEAVLRWLPGVQQYEDDLNDQWQSRHHRDEWRRFLRTLAERAEAGHDLTVLSGEIHLAGRGQMRLRNGKRLHQLIASGVSHPAPPLGYALGLSLLARAGEQPLNGRPMRMMSVPGRTLTYIADRNYLHLRRDGERWLARWHLERRGMTPALSI